MSPFTTPLSMMLALSVGRYSVASVEKSWRTTTPATDLR